MEKTTISVQELSAQMGISLPKAYELVKTPGFPTIRIGTSRNHMKPKGGKSAKPRFHVFLAIEPITDALAYVEFMKKVQTAFPVFDDPLKDGAPELLMGCPYYICDHLDRVEGGGIAAMYGDFSYFWIGERGKRSTKRLVERYADNGQVAYITSERIDAKLVLPEAVKLLKVKA